MGAIENRLKKIEAAQSKTKGFFVTPLLAFYGMRNCPPVWQEKPGALSDFFETGCGYCEGCTAKHCKMDSTIE